MSSSPKVAIVLGAGGVAGGAFHAGVLAALEEATGWDPRRAHVVVGTSAGSMTGAALRAGLAARDLLARQEGRPMSAEGQRIMAVAGPPVAPPPLRAPTSRVRSAGDIAATLARAMARPLSTRPVALLAGLLPEGSVGTEMIADGVASIHPAGWPSRLLWICAVRRSDGRLVVFGRDETPAVADAVAASCAIPGFFRPVEIGGESYVDGGAHSPTNADIVAAERPDLVIISSPMSHAGSTRRTGLTPVRRWSRLLLDTEAMQLRRRKIDVLAFQPTEEDIAVMGPNALDPSRRREIARHARESTLRRLARADTQHRLAGLTARA